MRTRHVIDIEAYSERLAILVADNVELSLAMGWAADVGYATPFAKAATALANGDSGPAKDLCRREARLHGREWAERLRDAIKEAVAEAKQWSRNP
jgi:hypothetical protein